MPHRSTPPLQLVPPPEFSHEPHSPVRDDSKLSPTEDLDREPDGVPHGVVGLTALFSVMLAMLVGVMFLTARVAAVALAVIAIPILVSMLRNKAERERDHVHPSR